MIIMVSGGRAFNDYKVMHDALLPYNELGNLLIVGGATGADELARRVWHYEFQLSYVVEPAPWKRTGRPAGMMRNRSMIDGQPLVPHASGLTPDLLILFPGGRGTAGAKTYAEERGIDTYTVVQTSLPDGTTGWVTVRPA